MTGAIIFAGFLQASVPTVVFDTTLHKECRSQNGQKYILDNMPILENKKWDSTEFGQRYVIHIDRESVTINSIVNKKSRTFDASYLATEKANLDVDAFIALFDKKPAIYWRETIKYNSYRFGIAKIVDGFVVSFCEGRYGPIKAH